MQLDRKNFLNNSITILTLIIFSVVISLFFLVIFIFKGVRSSWQLAVLMNKWYYEKLR